MLSLELTASEHWDEVFQASYQVQPSQAFPRRGYIPIPSFTVPVLLESSVLAISFQSLQAPAHWYKGGAVRQVIQFGNAPELQGRQVMIPVNRGLFLCLFERLAPQYQLRVEIPYYFLDSTISVWQYTGPVEDTTEALIAERTDSIRVDLVRIETKINQLF